MTIAKLEPDQERILLLQSELVRDDGFFLAGGTALGIRFGHRLSEDLDWFTAKRFDAAELAKRLATLSEAPTQVVQQGPHTLRAYYGVLETSFIRYAQLEAKPEFVDLGGKSIPIADVEMAAAMKAGAVYQRGTKRDFIDIHALSQLPGWSIGVFIDHATRSLPLSAAELTRALTYFVDADPQPMPRACTVTWDKVKLDITHGVREWARERSRGPER